MIKRIVLLGFVMALACVSNQCTKKTQDIDTAVNSITAESLAKNTQILSSDEFEGRAPVSKGEELTVNFLKEFRTVPVIKISEVKYQSNPPRTCLHTHTHLHP